MRSAMGRAAYAAFLVAAAYVISIRETPTPWLSFKAKPIRMFG